MQIADCHIRVIMSFITPYDRTAGKCFRRAWPCPDQSDTSRPSGLLGVHAIRSNLHVGTVETTPRTARAAAAKRGKANDDRQGATAQIDLELDSPRNSPVTKQQLKQLEADLWSAADNLRA